MKTNLRGQYPKQPLKPYWIGSQFYQVRLVTNPGGTWDVDSATFCRGWATLNGGWIVRPDVFKCYNPNVCLFSRLDRVEVNDELMVEAWLYNSTIRDFFNEPTDRELFRCLVDPNCLYELPLV